MSATLEQELISGGYSIAPPPPVSGPLKDDGSVVAGRVKQWVNAALSRISIYPVPQTDLFGARVKGLRKHFAVGATEATASQGLEALLDQWAASELIAGRELPLLERAALPVPEEVRRCVRVTTLRRLLAHRAAQWGADRQNLPPHALEPLLTDFDQIITRHAAQMRGASPPPAKPESQS